VHGYCKTFPPPECIDNGTTSPAAQNPLLAFGFTTSPGPQSGDLFVDVLVPNHAAINPTTLTITLTGTLSGTATVFSSSAWTSGDLDAYLGAPIMGAEPANPIVPGGSATYTVSVTGISGFSGPVSLSVGSESGFPTGITSGGFNPPSITDAGTSTLTMNTTTSTVPWALSLTITGTSGTLSHTASSTLLMDLAAPNSPAAIAGDKQVSLSWGASVEASSYHVKRATIAGPL
jgi:hypothetical protein